VIPLDPPGPLTPREAFSWARAALTSIDPDAAALEARLFVTQAWGGSEHSIHMLPNVPSAGEEVARLFQYVRRRLTHEPAAYILGRREFWSLDFAVSPAVLIPRPDSETLIRQALDLLPDRNRPYTVLDLGTGSGSLLLAFLHERPNAMGVGIDSSAPALEIAHENARNLGLTDRARFALGDWTDGIADRFDLILCNPPYVADSERNMLMPDVRDHEPWDALFAGPEGMSAYARIVPQIPFVLSPGSIAIFEAGRGQATLIAEMCASQGLECVEIRDDLNGISRSVAVRL
jgi:release factor glutamine methyltransferase